MVDARAEPHEKLNYSNSESGVGFLNLLRLAQSVDWNRGRFCELAIVRSLKLRPQPERYNMHSTNLSQRETSKREKWRNFLQSRRRPHDPLLVFNMTLFNLEPAWNCVFNPSKQRESVWA
jgi:hypothetical protein